MKTLAILILGLIGLVAADNPADYVPKAFFYIDENGNPTPARPINPEVLHRARRQVQGFQPFGQPAFGFQPINFPQIQPGQGSGTFTSSSQTLSSRFGEDEPVITGQTTVVHQKDGKYQQTNTVLRPDGTTYVNKQSGRVKRQQSQTQSQDGSAGNQQQIQSQNQPGGQQFQSQNQGQGIEPIATPAGNQQYPEQQPPQQQYPQQQPPQQQYPQQQPPQQQYPQQPPQQQYPQQQPNSYPQQPNYSPFPQAPFGFGTFGQPGFGFPQAGFGMQPGFGFPFQNPFQPGFGGAGFPVGGGQGVAPGQGVSGNRLDSRFADDDSGTVTSGGSQIVTNQNGVFHSTSSVLGPDGKVRTSHRTNATPGRIDSRFGGDDSSDSGISGVSGGTQVYSSNNGVFHSTTSVLGPDGKVHTTHQTNQGRSG